MTSDERAFHEAMLDLYRRAKAECSYNPTYFLRMVVEMGGLEAARALLHATTVSDGFTTLWEKGRLDLSVEAHALRPEFRGLFSDDERAIAQSRLEQYGHATDD